MARELEKGIRSIFRNSECLLRARKDTAGLFRQQYPNSVVTDKCLVDVDNDGLEELLVVLNTYSGINKTQEEEARKNGFDMRYVGIIFPKGKNPTESLIVLGNSIFPGTKVITVIAATAKQAMVDAEIAEITEETLGTLADNDNVLTKAQVYCNYDKQGINLKYRGMVNYGIGYFAYNVWTYRYNLWDCK